MTPHRALPGIRSRSCSASRASSSTSRTRRSSSIERKRSRRSSRPSGTTCEGTPMDSRNPARTADGSAGTLAAPRRSAYSWPSGKAYFTWWAACRASAVLPTPATPEMPTAAGAVRAGSVSAAHRWDTSASLPTNPTSSDGSWAGGGTRNLLDPTGSRRSARRSCFPSGPPCGNSAGGVPLRMCCCNDVSSEPGSIPCSSSRSLRTSW